MEKTSKIDKNNIEEIIALSPLQQGILFHYLKNIEENAYLVRLLINIEGNIDANKFKEAWLKVVEHNDALRTIFRWEGLKAPIQIILKQISFTPDIIDISEDYKKNRDSDKMILNTENQSAPDLTNSPYKVSLYKKTDVKYTMVISHHHIIYDGWSTGILINEFFSVYNGLINNQVFSIPDKAKFINYIKFINQQDSQSNIEYWKKYLNNYSSNSGFQESAIDKITNEPVYEYVSKLTPELYKGIAQYARDHKVTIASVFYTIWGILMQKGSNSADVVFGTTISGRNVKLKNIESTIGLFINTLPLRVVSKQNDTLTSLVSEINQQLIEREKYETYSLAEIKKTILSDPNEELFNALLIIENYPLDLNKFKTMGNISIESYKTIEKTHYDLTVTIKLFEEPEITLSYNPQLYSHQRISQFYLQFVKLLDEIAANPEKQIIDTEIISEDEKQKLIKEFNQTYLEYNKNITLNESLDIIAKQYPDKDILVFGNENLTYSGLIKKSSQFANILISKGLGSGDIAGVMVNRSPEMIIALFAVLKAGASYVPIDPGFPGERINYMVDNSKLKILISDNTNIEKARNICKNAEIINILNKEYYTGNDPNPVNNSKPTAPAYIIYTSGTTGTPKGVVISHRNVINFIGGIVSNISFNADDKILALTTISFDIFVLETFLPLLKGVKIVIANEEEQNEPEKLCSLIVKEKISMLQITPSRLKLLMSFDEELKSFKNVRVLMLGGEALPEKLFHEVKQKFSGKIYNLYGPTETTVWSTLKDLTNESKVTIGKPIANTSVFILDNNNKLQPVGYPGELCIGGDGVGMGYFNKPEITTEKFFTDNTLCNTLIYKTGDVARRLPDGDIECMGRIDNQVKIRGYRIETEEIETLLSNHDGINESVVISFIDKDDIAYLCAYYTSEKQYSSKELSDYLAASLPEYMIPSYFIRIPEIPLTPNGKINRRALPKPDIEQTGEFVTPVNEIETALREIWTDVLGVEKDKISTNANFFKLGGHSLKTTILVSRILKKLNSRLSIKDVYTYPSIKEQADFIKNEGKTKYSLIPKIEERDFYPLTSSQERLYILQQMEENFVVYNLSGIFYINEKVDEIKFEKVINQLIERHESLRTSFKLISGKPVQIINKNYDFKIEKYSIASKTEEELHKEIEKVYRKFIRPFELDKSPLFRAGLINVNNTRSYLIFDMHHIISDGTSIEILINEFSDLYGEKQLSETGITYKDYCLWHNEKVKSKEYTKQLNYWINLLKGELPVLDIPTDYERPNVQNFEGSSYNYSLDKKVFEKIKQLSEEKGASLFMFLLSSINILLSKLSNSNDIIVGTTVAGRNLEELQNIAGMFVNTLPLRNSPLPELSFTELLHNVRKTCLDAFENQDIRFEDIIEKTKIIRNPSRNPLFDVLINYQHSESRNNIILKEFKRSSDISKFDLTFDCTENENTINIRIEYAKKLFNEASIKRFKEYLDNILQIVIFKPEIKLRDIEIISKEEKNLILNNFNNTSQSFRENTLITTIFEEQVDKYPENTALQLNNEKITYSVLDKKSNQIARFLINKGIKAGDIVGIIGERSFELVAGIYGILKAGAAYLPIDKNNPAKRINYILTDSKSKLLLIPKNKINIDECPVEAIYLNNPEIYSNSDNRLAQNISPDNVAYIIYTSGSTGNPKGVMIGHRQVVNLIYSLDKMYPLCGKDSFLLKTPCVFDVSVSELFGWFTKGGKLIILPEGDEKDAFKLLDTINKNKITHINFVPSLFNAFVSILNKENCSLINSLKYIFLAGEPVIPSSVLKFRNLNNSVKLENLYGPTEATVYASYYHLEEWDEKTIIPIGKPLPNYNLLILNKDNNLNGTGIAGELYIFGAGLANGYLNNQILTDEKFIYLPSLENRKAYKTGDLARWKMDGNIEFLGRIDHQVKIRGYRIELDEIENKIRELKFINEAVVTAFDTGNKDYSLCAYIVSEKNIEAQEIKMFLINELPEYMVPNHYIQLEKLPLTTSNKIDRKALPKPVHESTSENVKPRNTTESQLLDIWSEVLNLEKDTFGITSNFFDLGGHSLKGTIVLYKIEQLLSIRLPLATLFKYPNISGLAEQLNMAGKLFSQEIIGHSGEKESYPLSPWQKRIYILQEFDPKSMVYNMPARFEITGKLDLVKFEDTIKKIITRHQVLKTSFKLNKNIPEQVINDNVDFKLDTVKAGIDDIDEILKSFLKPFELGEPPLFRIKLLIINENYHILLIDFHHIIFDGISAEILISDFNKFYHDKTIENLKIQYVDYAEWFNKKDYSAQKQYWLKEFSGNIPVLNINSDYNRPVSKSYKGEVFNFTINNELYAEIKKIASHESVTSNIVLLAAYFVFISKLSKHEDIIIGIPVSCRQNNELHYLIGMFVNTIAIRCYPNKNKSFIEFIHEVKQKVINGIQNQDYPFDILANDLNIKTQNNKNPLFDIAFSYEKKEALEKENFNEISIKPLEYKNTFSRFDLTLFVIEWGNNSNTVPNSIQRNLSV